MKKPFYKSKTVWTCIATVAYAISGWYIGNIEANTAIMMVFSASGVYGVRDAMK